MADVTLSSRVRSNLLSLSQISDSMSVAQNRLSTGKKVNTAVDNASSYFTSKNLNNRASDLSSLLDGMANAQKTIEAASTGISTVTGLIKNMQGAVRQARQDT